MGEGRATLRVGMLVGSLRARSFNRALAEAALEECPPGLDLVEIPIGELPLYNQDLEGDAEPESVRRFKDAIRPCDAMLFVTPEYNYSIPGVLKNAIDWASRPTGRGPLQGKPAAVIGASGGPVGTRRAQLHLRQICHYLDMMAVNKPEVVVGNAADKLDDRGRLVDEHARANVRQVLANLRRLTLQLRTPVD